MSRASSALRLTTSSRRASAATRSPVWSTSRSPGTTSLAGSTISFPARTTVASGAASFRKARGGLLGPVFLDKPQNDTGQHNGQNDPGVQGFPQQKGDRRGHDEDGDEKILELPQENPPGRNLFAGRQGIRAIKAETLLSLRLAQATGAGPQ